MKYLIIGILFLCSYAVNAQQFDGKSNVTEAEIMIFSDNDIAEALFLKKIDVKSDLHEAFVQNPEILSEQIKLSSTVANKFKQYVTVADEATRNSLEQELLVYYQ